MYHRRGSLEGRIKPVESLLFRGALVAVGPFQCHVSHVTDLPISQPSWLMKPATT